MKWIFIYYIKWIFIHVLMKIHVSFIRINNWEFTFSLSLGLGATGWGMRWAQNSVVSRNLPDKLLQPRPHPRSHALSLWWPQLHNENPQYFPRRTTRCFKWSLTSTTWPLTAILAISTTTISRRIFQLCLRKSAHQCLVLVQGWI